MADKKINAFIRNLFKIGTPECAISFAVIAMFLAIMILAGLFWQMLLVLALMLIGAFLGGVKNKKKWFQSIVNRIFPPKNTIAYRENDPDLEKSVRDSLDTEKQASPETGE